MSPTGSAQWPHYNYNDPADLKALIENGMVWKCPAEVQTKAVEAILADPALLNDKCPPKTSAAIQNIIAGRGQA
jgi:hypothetical protein